VTQPIRNPETEVTDMTDKRRIGVIIGSDSDLSQCVPGLALLKDANDGGEITVLFVNTMSIHRNTVDVLDQLTLDYVDVLITGAGWANHLTGTCDAYLRYRLKKKKPVVVGVAFECSDDPRKTQAAINSVRYVPGTQVVYRDDNGPFIGEEGFFRACDFAAYGELPEIELKEPKSVQRRTLEAALELAREKQVKSAE